MCLCVQLSSEEEERRRLRRERNKQAAAKCRQKRVDLTNQLLSVGDNWLSDLTLSMLDLGIRGRWFDFRSGCYRMVTIVVTLAIVHIF